MIGSSEPSGPQLATEYQSSGPTASTKSAGMQKMALLARFVGSMACPSPALLCHPGRLEARKPRLEADLTAATFQRHPIRRAWPCHDHSCSLNWQLLRREAWCAVGSGHCGVGNKSNIEPAGPEPTVVMVIRRSWQRCSNGIRDQHKCCQQSNLAES